MAEWMDGWMDGKTERPEAGAGDGDGDRIAARTVWFTLALTSS